MVRFCRPDDDMPTLVSVMEKAPASTAVGAGALLTSRYVLTCAHVVNDALDRGKQNTERPARSERLSVTLHHASGKHESTARLAVWVPPRPSPGGYWGEGDLAVLELDEPAPSSTRVVVWQEMPVGLRVRAYHGGGDRLTFADTTIKASDTWYYYAEGELTGASIQEGYSGSPLFRRDHPTSAVGLVIKHIMNEGPFSDRQVVRRTLVLPWQHIRDELLRVDAHEVIRALPPGSLAGTGTVPDIAADLLLKLFDSEAQLKRQAHRLATKLGYRTIVEEPDAIASPPEEELAALLFTDERALATLAELLAKTVDTERLGILRQLLALGRQESGVRLLSPGEYQKLLDLLKRVNTAHPQLFCQAARHIFQFVDRPPGWVAEAAVPEAQMAAAVDDMDEDSAQELPQLLRLAVFLSAAVTDRDTRKSLEAWCDDVHQRLGRDRSLLADCRVQASSWAKLRRRSMTRIVADLSRTSPGDESYTCYFWRVHAGRAPEVAGAHAGPYTAEQIGRKIHQLAQEHHSGGDQPSPWIDVVVGRDQFDLPVDGWTASPMADVLAELDVPSWPGQEEERLVLGAQYQVALRLRRYSEDPCKEEKRRGRLRRRWAAGRTVPLVITEDATSREVVTAVDDEHGDASWAVLHAGAEHRSRLLPLCLALGVPVVLWDREAAHPEDAQRLDGIVGDVALPDLPETIREFRRDVYYRARTLPARPAMVWDDPDMELPAPPDYNDPPDAWTHSERMAGR